MNWAIYGLECIVISILFTCAIMIPLCRNPVWWIHDYPEDIQEKYFETHERIPTQPLSVPVLLKKGAALILALVLFVGLVLLVGAEHMDKAYHQKKYHVVHSVIGMVLGLIPCLLCGLIVMAI